ncbi:MAG: hypothetical protein HW412_290 [Bacteroidetes bacterium]|nr:hypothetical protein [Bacteroidota bacterium]
MSPLPSLPCLFVKSMLVAKPAKLLVLDPTRLLLLVLCGRIVSSLAVGTFQCDNVSHLQTPEFKFSFELATGIEPVTSSLPRKCSTN